MAQAKDNDGGRLAARGFQYQYLRTLEAMLNAVRDQNLHAIRIEGPVGTLGQSNGVDYDLIDIDHRSRLAAQVKSKKVGASFDIGEALNASIGLIKGHDASQYQVSTNGIPTPSVRGFALILEEDNAPNILKRKLDKLFSAAPARRAQIINLTDQQLERLTRCHFDFDNRDEHELRISLREYLRDDRNSERSGLGERSAGMLTGYLTAEILRRAVDAQIAEFTIQDFCSLLLVDSEHLTHLTGIRDWGVIVGAIPSAPDVPRPKLLERIINFLPEHRTNHARQIVLVGLSGIGKSSLAAGYIYDRADSYDCIFWVDAENDQSLLRSFRRILIYLRPSSEDLAFSAPADQVITHVHTELCRVAGRWAIIFDNVTSQRDVDPWIPASGNGDVIMTSIDSVARRGAARVVDVGAMAPSESIQLLCTRLHLTGTDAKKHSGDLARLAAGLAHWPLAIELAAGYIDTCGISLTDVDWYLAQLKLRALSDSDSLPPRYPRTIAAALRLCTEQLQLRGDREGISGANARVALAILVNAAFVASRQLPLHMLVASTIFAIPKEKIGVVYVDPDMVNMGEVVRELRRFSLVAFDEDLPPIEARVALPIMDADRSITINSVVQEFIRSNSATYGLNDGRLNILADNMQRWLTQALDLNALDRASVLFTHAEILVRNLLDLRVTGYYIALLYGNVASACSAKGDHVIAANLLYAELEIVSKREHKDELLATQAKLSLINIYMMAPVNSPIA